MAKIFRCPACGALWKVGNDFSGSRLQCSECHTVFSSDKAEMLEVDDERLAARLAALRPAPAAPREPELRTEETFSSIADELSAFESRTGGVYIPPKHRSAFGWVAPLIGFVAFVALATEAALWAHSYVLAQFPVLTPVYEKVCRRLPCPGFAWQDAHAIKVTATLAADMVNPHQVVVSLGLTNQSQYAQRLPSLELRFLDAAGDTLAQKLLDPGSYGLAADTVLKPAQKAMVTLTPETSFPIAPSAVRVTPMGELR